MAEPGKGHWHCPWSACATFTTSHPEEGDGPYGTEFGEWVAALADAPTGAAERAALAAPAGALLAAFYAGWEAACRDHAGFARSAPLEWVPDDDAHGAA